MEVQLRAIHPYCRMKGCALQHWVKLLTQAKEHDMKTVLSPFIGQSFPHLKWHHSASLLSLYKASTSTPNIFGIFPLIFFCLTDVSHTQDKPWADLSLRMFAGYPLTHVQLNLCKVRNFCLLHSADW